MASRARRSTSGWPVTTIEVDRTVNPLGVVSLGNQPLHVGIALAGQRVTIRLEDELAHVLLGDGTAWRTISFSLPGGNPTPAHMRSALPAGANLMSTACPRH
jgi:hypothetical protein